MNLASVRTTVNIVLFVLCRIYCEARIAFLFLFTPAQERISNQLEKWLDSLLDEFGPAREYPVHAEYTVQRNVNLLNPHGQSISFSYELPIPSMRTDFGISEYGFELNDGTQYTVESLQEVTYWNQ